MLIGDEISAAGFRLAGVVVRTPAAEETADTLAWARARAPLVLITAGQARHLPRSTLEAALAATRPLVVVVPDVREHQSAPDLGARWRGQLEVKL
ncbi:MAG: Vacuolar H+transporting two-sector ATPase F subunit [Gammaproteobacteria bacterium]|nr:Vacuolar H+transporting two-sector ATPase F subunit [Gammaproteobacteria bacterium]